MSEPQNDDKHHAIEKNIKNMQLRSYKKKYAQQMYYRRKSVLNVINESVNNKMPVHARLGMRTINLRRGAYQFGNNDVINNRLPLRRKLIRNQGIPLTLQNRLRLRRKGTGIYPNKTTDYTIQIRNNLATPNYNNAMNNMKHSCIGQLNAQLQQEISVIQTEANNESPEVIPSLPIHVAGYGVTNISLSQRFSV